MKPNLTPKSLVGSTLKASIAAVAAMGIAQAMPAASYAGSLINGWNYAIDSPMDGIAGGVVGGNTNPYEIYGMGIKVTNSFVYVGVRANNPHGTDITDDGIAWGDLFFDFAPGSGYQPAGKTYSYAVRFRSDYAAEDNGMQRGVYANSGALDSQTANRYNSLSQYSTAVTNGGGSASIGDLPINSPYYPQNEEIKTAIDPSNKGTYLGGITDLNSTQLTAMGFPSSAFGNGNSFGFSFARPAGFDINAGFTASLFWQCVNDAVAVQQQARPVPLPALAWGVIAAVGFGGAQLARKKRIQKNNLSA
ncbi:MAG: XDD3 family exosortase-dependent surface protein [Pseudanabaenaceae cyanobacterium]